jgi:hypothetical protein
MLRTGTVEDAPMTAKFTRRHLFARLGAGLAGLWSCLRGRAPAAANPPAPPVVPSPQETIRWISYDCSPATFVSTTTYDCHGRVIAVRYGSAPQPRVSSLPPWARKIYVWDEQTEQLVERSDLDERPPSHPDAPAS